MKSNVYYGVDDFRYETIEERQLGKSEVLLKMKACGLCGTDIHKAIENTVETPIVLGHEVSGEVVGVGEDVVDYNIGDRVFVTHHVPCFTCKHCKRGAYSLCPQFKETNLDPGGFSEYIRVPELHVKHTMGKLPADMSYEVGAMVEPLACCIHGFERVPIQAGDNVLIMGAGQIGAIQLQLAKHFLANKVFMSDVNQFRLNKMLEIGADEVIRSDKENVKEKIKEMTDGRGVDIVVISAGLNFLLPEAMECVARGGTVLVFAPFKKELVAIPAYRFFEDEISIVGAYSSTPYNYTPALEMLRNGIIDVKKMVTHRFPLSKLDEAIDLAHDHTRESLKVIILPEEN